MTHCYLLQIITSVDTILKNKNNKILTTYLNWKRFFFLNTMWELFSDFFPEILMMTVIQMLGFNWQFDLNSAIELKSSPKVFYRPHEL